MKKISFVICMILITIPLFASQQYVLGEVFSADPGC